MGNKGGLHMHFKLNDKHFNFIAVHLIHGQNNREKRDEMMSSLVKFFKVDRQEMDSDLICDYNFIMGDLNYRFNSSYEQMIDNQDIHIACKLMDELDQLSISRKGLVINEKKGKVERIRKTSPHYPCYYEHKITF